MTPGSWFVKNSGASLSLVWYWRDTFTPPCMPLEVPLYAPCLPQMSLRASLGLCRNSGSGLVFPDSLVLARRTLAEANPSLRLYYAQRIYFPPLRPLAPANKETNYTSSGDASATLIRISWLRHFFRCDSWCNERSEKPTTCNFARQDMCICAFCKVCTR